jgi:uncharacterized membrane protein
MTWRLAFRCAWTLTLVVFLFMLVANGGALGVALGVGWYFYRRSNVAA